jgi:polysaccharide export outer membrane protein
MINPRTLAVAATLLSAVFLGSTAGAQPKPPTASAAAPPIGGSSSGPAPVQPVSKAAQAATEYIIGPEDTIEIGIVGQADRIRARVYSDGTIQMNLIGKVMASGNTPRELAAQIAQLLKAGGYYANPIIEVEVTGYASRYVTVLGAVASPGLVPINRAYRLSEILAKVGGVQGGAADYLIVRPESGPERRYFIEKLSAGGVEDDPLVTAGDKIFSPVAQKFYILGQVKSPGPYPVKEGLTIAEAIAMAGGVTESGNDKNAKVARAGKSKKMKTTEKVLPDDIVTISEKMF